MARTTPDGIRIVGARQHNLRGLDLTIRHDALTVVTGVSGSGKSSLAFDTLFREGQRRYLESLSSHARQLLGKLDRPDVDRVEGVRPALAIDQRAAVRSPRSTVGTLSELYDHLRLLFARVATAADGTPKPAAITSTLLSFNTPQGACPACKGLGVEDRVDPALLIADPTRTLRQGALVPTTPNGYIVYSQVTVDVLDQVCAVHGFSVDQPWEQLDPEQQRVVLYGSDRIKVPFGKHPLESRMRWSGITARPRKEGTYRGIVPVIEEIVARSRNRNALRFVRTARCSACGGTRLRPEAQALRLGGRSIADWAALTLHDAAGQLQALTFDEQSARLAAPITRAFETRAAQIERLGLGHLTLDRPSPTLSSGEVQRLRLATQVATGLRGLLYVLDEPSVGLHGSDAGRLLDTLRRLRDTGNTVVVVEHDPATIRAADELVDIGPGPGRAGGRLLHAGTPGGLLGDTPATEGARQSPTRAFLVGDRAMPSPRGREGTGDLWVRGARSNNLRSIDAPFRLGALNVVTGVSGAGKTTLVERTLGRALRQRLHGSTERPAEHDAIEGADVLDKVIDIDQSPIGRTPRSNPATYTKVFDAIRGCFAGLPAAKERGWGKGHFSFNVVGGRCEQCHGAGVETIGMHFLGDVEVTCAACNGDRFDRATLGVEYRGHSVLDVLQMSVDRALDLFSDQPRIRRILEALQAVGLGYLSLGQPSTTLSGGEAQRVKLAAELGRPTTGHTLLLLDEPTRGLHLADVDRLLQAIDQLVERGNTAVVVEHDPAVIGAADWVIDLGPGSGPRGGDLVVAGPPGDVECCAGSVTGAVLRGDIGTAEGVAATPASPIRAVPIQLRGVTTHNLRGLDVDIPLGRFTAITGVSGSGKSSLAFDTLGAECQARFVENLSTAVRRRVGPTRSADLQSASGLTAALTVGHRPAAHNPRSTVGTMTEVLDSLRLLFARAGTPHSTARLAAHFSFNDHRGACPECRGLGTITTCDPDRLITDPSRSLLDGALDGHRTGRFYGDRHGRYVAQLRAVGEQLQIDFERPFGELDDRTRAAALFGTGDHEYDVQWHYVRGKRRGTHTFRGTWDGLVAYVDEEYGRKHADRRGDAMRPLMKDVLCGGCGGERLSPEARAVRFAGQTLGQLERRSADALLCWIDALTAGDEVMDERTRAVATPLLDDVRRRLTALGDVGLVYLTLDRGAPTLSGGEFQRVRLASQLCSQLCGVTYVLDEPTVGLHSRDTSRLLSVLHRLRDAGNTVVVVEHDLQVIRAADHVIELGPGAGEAGGQIVAQGPPSVIAADDASPTGRHLAAEALPTPPRQPRPAQDGIQIEGARARNLLALDVAVPSGCLVAVTGVSGSGKTALVFETLAASLTANRPVNCSSLRGANHFDKTVHVDATPPTGSTHGTVATYCDVFDAIRTRFARSEVARERGWSKAWFATTRRGGRCEACEGRGHQVIEMGFLPSVVLPCQECNGSRYTTDTREALVHGHSIADVLSMSVDTAIETFADTSTIGGRLSKLREFGLGYLPLGQPTSTLSAGEIQRLKLSRGLATTAGEHRLYLLDEPTCGLHPDDVARLLTVLHRLVDAGHTVVVIEHDLHVVREADWNIDLGPDGGDGGGRLLSAGPPR